MTHLRLCTYLTVAASLALAAPAPAAAQSDLWHTVRERLFDYKSGRQAKSEPVRSDGAVERWGNGRHLVPTSNWTQDERLVDERMQDDRRQDDRRREERTTQVVPEKESAVVKPASKPTARARTATRAAQPRVRTAPVRAPQAQPEPTAAAAACTNVARVWDGARALARRGDESRAYDAYLRLLSSCTDEKELVGTVHEALRNLSETSLDMLVDEPVLAAPKLAPAMYAFRLQRLYAANRFGDEARALDLARQIRTPMLASDDVGALTLAGWLEQRAREPKEAERLFRAALRHDRDANDAREGLVFALLAQGKVASAAREAERLDGPSTDLVMAEVLLAQAREDIDRKQFDRALVRLNQAEELGLAVDSDVLETRAWALKGAKKPDEAAELFITLVEQRPEDRNLREGAIESLYAAGNHQELRELAHGDSPLAPIAREAVARRLDEQGRRAEAAKLRGEKIEGMAGHLAGTVGGRIKSGDTGEGRLTELSAPIIDAEVPVKALGENTRVAVNARRLHLSDGRNDVTGTEVRVRAQTRVDETEIMVGAGASKVGQDTKATVEAKVRQYTDSGYVEAGISREPVRDSVRSYAGLRVDTVDKGIIPVGRVFDTGGYVAGSYRFERMNQYRLDWNLHAGSIKGVNSPSNGYYGGEAAVMKDIEIQGLDWMSVGTYLSMGSHQRDENQFDGAYGGYYSPKSNVGVGLKAHLLSEEGKDMLFKASGKLGYTSRGLSYGNESGMVAEATGEVAFLATRYMALGAGLVVRSSPGYTDLGVRVGVNLFFEPRTKLYSSDLGSYQVQ